MTTLFAVLLTLAALAMVTPLLLRALIRSRLRNYRIHVNTVDAAAPLRPKSEKTVAVIGGGVAGMASAVTLARRGFKVTWFEAKHYLGGKLGSWEVELSPGKKEWVSHGFHAFFRHYYNLNRFLDSLGLRKSFRSIGDYAIVNLDGSVTSFHKLLRTPVFNLLSMSWNGVFRLREILFGPAKDLLGIFLEYDEKTTFAELDRLSLKDFDRVAKLPRKLKVAFNTFARAFFAEEDRVSLAELVKSFHFYYLSHDHGLIYDHPTRDFEASILKPIRDEFHKHGGTLKMATPVTQLSRASAGFSVNGTHFDSVVLATDVVGARNILTQAEGLSPTLKARFAELRPGQRYSVLRVWTDKDIRPDLPGFVITDREVALDAVSMVHRIEDESAEWVKKHGGAVIELHSYAVPDSLATPEQVRAALLREAEKLFPELHGWKIAHEHFQLNADFTAFHRGLHEQRPTVECEEKGLYFAGDWVKLPFPAMLLEGAFASGLCAANAVLAAEGLQQEQVDSVPLQGLLFGLPKPPGRRALTQATSS